MYSTSNFEYDIAEVWQGIAILREKNNNFLSH